MITVQVYELANTVEHRCDLCGRSLLVAIDAGNTRQVHDFRALHEPCPFGAELVLF